MTKVNGINYRSRIEILIFFFSMLDLWKYSRSQMKCMFAPFFHLLYIHVFLLTSIRTTLSAVDEQFFSSCRVGDIVKVKEYLDSGVPPSSRDAKGNTGFSPNFIECYLDL